MVENRVRSSGIPYWNGRWQEVYGNVDLPEWLVGTSTTGFSSNEHYVCGKCLKAGNVFEQGQHYIVELGAC
jgi:hypothetical protein